MTSSALPSSDHVADALTGRTNNQTVVAIAVTRCAAAAEEITNNQTVAESAREREIALIIKKQIVLIAAMQNEQMKRDRVDRKMEIVLIAAMQKKKRRREIALITKNDG
jgi:hypothetical protein